MHVPSLRDWWRWSSCGYRSFQNLYLLADSCSIIINIIMKEIDLVCWRKYSSKHSKGSFISKLFHFAKGITVITVLVSCCNWELLKLWFLHCHCTEKIDRLNILFCVSENAAFWCNLKSLITWWILNYLMPSFVHFDRDLQSSGLKMKKQFFRVKQLADQHFSRWVNRKEHIYVRVYIL
jgi:hypothetical protein